MQSPDQRRALLGSPEELLAYGRDTSNRLYGAKQEHQALLEYGLDLSQVEQIVSRQGILVCNLLSISEQLQNPFDLSMQVTRGRGEIFHDFSQTKTRLEGIPSDQGDFDLDIPLSKLRNHSINTSTKALAHALFALAGNVHEAPEFENELDFTTRTIDEVIAIKDRMRSTRSRLYGFYLIKRLFLDRLMYTGDIQLPGGVRIFRRNPSRWRMAISSGKRKKHRPRDNQYSSRTIPISKWSPSSLSSFAIAT